MSSILVFMIEFIMQQALSNKFTILLARFKKYKSKTLVLLHNMFGVAAIVAVCSNFQLSSRGLKLKSISFTINLLLGVMSSNSPFTFKGQIEETTVKV